MNFIGITNDEGKVVRINLDNVTNYAETTEGGTNFDMVNDQTLHAKETVEQIDKYVIQLLNQASL